MVRFDWGGVVNASRSLDVWLVDITSEDADDIDESFSTPKENYITAHIG
jgi:hypothetical protein